MALLQLTAIEIDSTLRVAVQRPGISPVSAAFPTSRYFDALDWFRSQRCGESDSMRVLQWAMSGFGEQIVIATEPQRPEGLG